MTRPEINRALSAILTTALEQPSGAPLKQGIVCAALKRMGYGFEDFQVLRELLVTARLVDLTPDTMALTRAGRLLARIFRLAEG